MSGGENIVITGFMGTGKSTVGKLVAAKLERQFVDMDLVIEERFGLPIPEIFGRHGEALFRTVERGLAHELSTQSGLVIATGGGALVPEEMRDLMGRTGKLICLNADQTEISARLSEADNRPLASNWQALFEQRQSAYARIPNQIETSGKTIEAIACEIVAMCDGRIHVRTPVGGYDIWIGEGILKDINRHVDRLGLRGHAVIVTNETVAPLYAEALASRLPRADIIAVKDGEEYKNLETVSSIYDEMLALGADRGTTLIALGGGVLGDMAGYVAATYMRGIRLIQVPTTLLAMVDSSVGGKVGIDLPQGKNLIGAFKQPEAVLVDTDVMESLPPLQWRCGMAEVIKHGLISRPALLDLENWEKENLVNLLRHAIQVKVEVVEEDPYEQGIRAHLNLGHTFGHAIEKLTQYSVPHGEAVAIGICKAARLSRNCGLIDEQLVQKVISTFERIGLPVGIELNPEEWYAAMSTDKKWKAGKSRFVLLKALGEATVVEGLPKEEVLAVL
ncbi:MAG: 3-dehydroquinate synthase [Chloroflexi bacterium]|nr:3-dehydroquinate synthase [Chloroflexota bacterium]